MSQNKSGYIIVALAALLIGSAVVYGMKGAPNPADEKKGADPDEKGSGFTIKKSAADDSVIILEGESSKELATPFSLSDEASGTPVGASNGKSCYVGPEKWNEKWKSGQVKEECIKGHPQAPTPGYARYVFEAKEGGDYEVWVRSFWVDDCGNSISVTFADPGSDDYATRPLYAIGGTTYGRWVWNRLDNSELDAQKVRLKAGKNTLTICNREDDLYIDQILIRKADKKWPDPTGIAK